MVVLPGLLSQQLAASNGEDQAAAICGPGKRVPYRVWDVAGESDFDPNKLNAESIPLLGCCRPRWIWHSKVNCEMEIEFDAINTCPQCGFARHEQMPHDT
jgi:hypothetical protein